MLVDVAPRQRLQLPDSHPGRLERQEREPGDLAVLKMAHDLRVAAGDDELLERLENADGPPWRALRQPLFTLRAA